MCHRQENIEIIEFLKNSVGPFVIGITTYIVTAKIDDWKNRKKYSRLGIAIMDSLIEEVITGISIMSHFNETKEIPTAFLPNKSWFGAATINDDVLLRIIEVSKDKLFQPYLPKDIRIHCKNYFDMIGGQWNENVKSLGSAPELLVINSADNMINGMKYLEASKNVLKMLNQTKALLIENEERLIPK